MKFLFLLLFTAILFPETGQAQPLTRWMPEAPYNYSFIHPLSDEIKGVRYLAPLLDKLCDVRQGGKGVVRIVHIGDSHIQADMFTGVLRAGFQEFFGDAGRGLVFPYQVARTNAPNDIKSSSNVSWQGNRLSQSVVNIPCGLSAFAIHTSQPGAILRIGLKADSGTNSSFDRVRFFLGKDSGCYQLLSPSWGNVLPLSANSSARTASVLFTIANPVTEVYLQRCNNSSGAELNCYGASLEKTNTPGVLYHAIGANGAQFFQYNKAPLFWEQLPALQADCYIVSMGTNEAQGGHLQEAAFLEQCHLMVAQLRKAAPKAVIIFTTPAGSYTHSGKPNAVLGQVHSALVSFCEKEQIACWDLYNISSGFPGALSWRRYNLMSHDLIHYNAQGYRLQGQLLLKAFATAYNNYDGLK